MTKAHIERDLESSRIRYELTLERAALGDLWWIDNLWHCGEILCRLIDEESYHGRAEAPTNRGFESRNAD